MPSALWLATPACAAVVAAAARWLVQGSGNVYTATERRFYVPDPDLGWRVAADAPVWLGLELLAVLAAAAAGLVGAAWLVGRRERRRGRTSRLRIPLGGVAAATLVVPAWAFASGLGPARGVLALPEGATAAAPTAGREGRLELPAGTYEVVAHAGTAVTATLEAGKERFEARFERGITGTWTADPRDLTRPTTAEISVDASVVDTGIKLRSQHARDEYLRAGTFPRITLRLGELIAARQDGPAQVAFRSGGTVDFLGEAVAVEITGHLRAADAAARARLGLPADAAVILVQAELALTVSGTALRADRDSFDSDRLPIHVALVLVHRAPT